MTKSELLQGYRASGGAVQGDALDRSAKAVWAMLLSESRGRILETDSDGPEAQLVQQCFDHMVDAADSGGEVQSETLGQWTKTYRTDSKSRDRRLLSLLRQYLGETGLLYRGWPL